MRTHGIGGGIVPVAYRVEVAVTARHDDDHGHDFSLGQHVVQHEVGFAGQGPAIFGVCVTVQQVKDGVAALLFGVVARRSVDDVGCLIIGIMQAYVGVEDVPGNLAVRDGGQFPGRGGLAGNQQVAVEVDEVGMDFTVQRIEHVHAVDDEGVAVVLGFEGRRGG